MKSLARTAAYRFGLLPLAHRLNNRDHLTVVMFHRVLPETDPEWRTASPGYTMSDRLFDACLGFFRRHYTVIDLATLRAAGRDRMPLPPRPLLITFDDGWADNLTVAAPILRAHRLPAVLFVAVGPILATDALWWQDVVDYLIGRRLLGDPCCAAIRDLCGDRPGPLPFPISDPRCHYHVLSVLAGLDEDERRRCLAPAATACGLPAAGERRQLLTPSRLAELAGFGITVGAHGFSHLPLTVLDDPIDDLRRCHRWLVDHGFGADGVALSFPHGRYDDAILQAARTIGFAPIFTSDTVLNPGAPASGCYGRISLSSPDCTAPSGAFAGDRLATWLFNRPRRPVPSPVAPSLPNRPGRPL